VGPWSSLSRKSRFEGGEATTCTSEAGRLHGGLTSFWRLQKAYMEAKNKKANPGGLA